MNIYHKLRNSILCHFKRSDNEERNPLNSMNLSHNIKKIPRRSFPRWIMGAWNNTKKRYFVIQGIKNKIIKKMLKIVSRETILNNTKNNKNNYIPNNVSRETIPCKIKNNKDKKSCILNNVSRETFLNFKRKLNCYLLAIFAAFLFIGFFDHYFWTLQQGKLIFWLVLGMLLIDIRFKVKNN